jgi:threonine dehydrogenase-like Zn-dependent dehydrogenase
MGATRIRATASVNAGIAATVFRLTRPFLVRAFEEPTGPLNAGSVLLRPLRVGVCGSDLKLYSGMRERSALLSKLPIALLHEAVAEVAAVGGDAPPGAGLQVGQRVVPSPNIPCTLADPERFPSPERACYACRGGGAGENYCLAGRFLSSNADGMARTAFVHPAACAVPVPAEIPDSLAVLTEPMATILAGLEQSAPPASGRFLVIGNGAMGILTVIALRAVLDAPPEDILMTGHRWEARAGTVEGLATPIEGSEAVSLSEGGIDVAFECVGGDAAPETMALATEALRPGGRGVLFGPSERPFLFDARKMIAKGLTFLGCNRARIEHFARALELCREPALWPLLERALDAKEFVIQSARDLDDALYHAWTKADPGRTVTIWGPAA